MNGPYFIHCWQCRITEQQAKAINKAIAEIDDSVNFVGPVAIPGNTTTGWLERPNDGTNDYNYQRDRNQQCVTIAKNILQEDEA